MHHGARPAPHRVRKHDMAIYLECIGWIVIDVVIIVGAVMNG
jgi:hypothetical protein